MAGAGGKVGRGSGWGVPLTGVAVSAHWQGQLTGLSQGREGGRIRQRRTQPHGAPGSRGPATARPPAGPTPFRK